MTTLNMKLSQQDSKIPTYSRMWVFMDSDEKNFVGSNADGVDRVDKENGKYAFLMESTSVEYVVERQCDLTQIGTLLDSKGYGIALPPSKFERFIEWSKKAKKFTKKPRIQKDEKLLNAKGYGIMYLSLK